MIDVKTTRIGRTARATATVVPDAAEVAVERLAIREYNRAAYKRAAKAEDLDDRTGWEALRERTPEVCFVLIAEVREDLAAVGLIPQLQAQTDSPRVPPPPTPGGEHIAQVIS